MQPEQAAVETLKFSDFHKRPIGPRGMEPGERLLALAGARVRLVGYAAHAAEPLPSIAILAPLPVTLGDEDESFADDLPAAVAYVHDIDARSLADIAACRGPTGIVGTLELGARHEADGRTSFVRMKFESAQCLAPAVAQVTRRAAE